MAKTTPSSKRPKVAPVRIIRYESHERSGQLEVHTLNRPAHVPEDAVVLLTWIDLPGENKQRTQRWSTWKETVRNDFAACAELQPMPWIIPQPKVHIESWVGSKGDKVNNRYKYLVDMLAPPRDIRRTSSTGSQSVARYGLLGLITDDRVLDPTTNFTVSENVSRAKNLCADGQERIRREVVVYVWSAV